MRYLRVFAAFLLAVIVTYAAASTFYTQQVLAQQAAFGAGYTPVQQGQAYLENLIGLAPAFGAVIAIALAVGFVVAALVKRVVRPLARIAYPVAGAAAVFTAIYLIENFAGGGGVGAIGGARDGVGMALQALAGLAGGTVFAVTRGVR